MNSGKWEKAAKKSLKSFWEIVPVLLGVILLMALFVTLVPKETYAGIFTGNTLMDPLIGAVAGSIAAGNPITSYILGGEFLKQGISLAAIASFILAWVTVGIIQFPIESAALGKKFAITRNAVSFVLAIVVAVLTVLTAGML